MMTTIHTSRFGELTIAANAILTLPSGMIGFPGSTRFVVLDHFRPAPFKWLQSVEEADLAFAIMDPVDLACDYRITLTEEDARDLGQHEEDEYAVFVVVTVRSADADGTTANLRGPVIVNLRTRIGKQVALAEDLPTRFPVFAPPLPGAAHAGSPTAAGSVAP